MATKQTDLLSFYKQSKRTSKNKLIKSSDVKPIADSKVKSKKLEIVQKSIQVYSALSIGFQLFLIILFSGGE